MRRLLALACLISTPVLAEPFDLQGMCLDCHHGGGNRYQAPILEGQQRAYLTRQLVAFRERHRDGFPMSAVLGGMSSEQLSELADQLAAMPWPSPSPRSTSTALIERGATLATTHACGTCHGAEQLGDNDVPRLAGQHVGYLRRQLAAFDQGQRDHPRIGADEADGTSSLTDRDIRALSAWLSNHSPARDDEPHP